MKARKLISLVGLALPLAGGSAACGGNGQPAADEPTAQTSQEQVITATGSVFAWPVAPITWDGMVGTWPIAVWSPYTIGAVAFDVAGMTNLGVTVVGYPNFVAVPITTTYLNAFVTPAAVSTTTTTSSLLSPSAWGYTGSYDDGTAYPYAYGAWAPFGGVYATYADGAYTPGWSAWYTPALTTNALMFNDMAVVNAYTPYTFNVTFQATSAAQMSTISTMSSMNAMALNVFATPITTDAIATATMPIPFMSMVWPVLWLPTATATTLTTTF